MQDGKNMSAATTAYVQEEAAIAIELLQNLTKRDPPRWPCGQMNPKPLKACRGVFFYHTQKMGLGLGVKWGRGWLLMRTGLDPPAWSPPVFYKVLEGSIGFTAGAGGSSTLIALGTDAAVEAFCSGKAVLGDDFSLSLGGKDDSADSSNAFDRSWKESIAWTIADGLMMDASLTGGRITVDNEHNHALYGPTASPTMILVTAETKKQPEGFQGVYKELNRIIAAADSDPRKFSGFQKHWHPQKVLRQPSTEQHLATGSAAPGTEENPIVQLAGGVNQAGAGAPASTEEKQGLLSGPAHSKQA